MLRRSLIWIIGQNVTWNMDLSAISVVSSEICASYISDFVTHLKQNKTSTHSAPEGIPPTNSPRGFLTRGARHGDFQKPVIALAVVVVVGSMLLASKLT